MKTKVLFVCLGNICRSPSAEAVFQHLVDEKGVSNNFFIDSAGTSAWHAGEKADARMRQHAQKRNIELTSISRKFVIEDFDRFDYIIAMDRQNLEDMKQMARNKTDLDKLHMMTNFSNQFNYDHVPDPYYGGEDGFELVLDILDDASVGFFRFLQKQN